jgi:hypothetical protein
VWVDGGRDGSWGEWWVGQVIDLSDVTVPSKETPYDLAMNDSQDRRDSCAHASGFNKERYLGAQTGDFVCCSCGKDFSPAEVAAIRARLEREV